MKKIISLVLSAFMIFSVFSLCAFGAKEKNTDLSFDESGKFTILNFSDFQDGSVLTKATKLHIKAAVKYVKPDLVVLTGDNIAGYKCTTKLLAKNGIKQFMDIFEELNVPVAMVYGNHDNEITSADKDYQMAVYEKYDCFVGKKGEAETGCGTYNLPILSNDKSRTAFNIWMTDSGTYVKGEGKSSYSAVAKDQIEWYKKTAQALKDQNGGKAVPAINFQHIVVPEIYSALTEVPSGTKGAVSGRLGDDSKKYYILPENAKGELRESPCPPRQKNNSGQFDAFLEMGDVLATVSGHDHRNTFEVDYKGIKIINTPAGGFGSYDDDNLGSRVFVLSEDGTFDTYCLKYLDVFAEDDEIGRAYFYLSSDTASPVKKLTSFCKIICSLLDPKNWHC